MVGSIAVFFGVKWLLVAISHKCNGQIKKKSGRLRETLDSTFFKERMI